LSSKIYCLAFSTKQRAWLTRFIFAFLGFLHCNVDAYYTCNICKILSSASMHHYILQILNPYFLKVSCFNIYLHCLWICVFLYVYIFVFYSSANTA